MSGLTNGRPSCEELAERLAPHAVADDDDEVAAHVERCASCRKEIGALRETLRAVKDAARVAPRDDAFWTDLTRDVRLAWGRAEAERSRRWLGLPRAVWAGIGVALAGAAALALVLSLHGSPAPAQAPQTGSAGSETARSEDHELPFVDEEDAEDSVDTVAGEADPYETVEDLDDEELERVLAALAKGV